MRDDDVAFVLGAFCINTHRSITHHFVLEIPGPAVLAILVATNQTERLFTFQAGIFLDVWIHFHIADAATSLVILGEGVVYVGILLDEILVILQTNLDLEIIDVCEPVLLDLGLVPSEISQDADYLIIRGETEHILRLSYFLWNLLLQDLFHRVGFDVLLVVAQGLGYHHCV